MSEYAIEISFMLTYYFQKDTDLLVSGAIANEVRSVGAELIGEEGGKWSVELTEDYMFIGFDERRDLYALHGYLQELGWGRVLLNAEINAPDRL